MRDTVRLTTDPPFPYQHDRFVLSEKGERHLTLVPPQLRVYLAAWFERADEMNAFARLLRQDGIDVVSRWIEGEHKVLAAGDRERFALEDVEDVRTCDVLMVYAPAGDEHKGSGGRHTELGMAYAWRKELVIVGPRTNIFHWLPDVLHLDDLTEARAALRAYAQRLRR
jgi:hypothetical protein